MGHFEEKFVFIQEYLNANITAIKAENARQKIENEKVKTDMLGIEENIAADLNTIIDTFGDKVDTVGNRTDKLEKKVFPEIILANCQEYADEGETENGVFKIQPDKSLQKLFFTFFRYQTKISSFLSLRV